jgi:hypothetical protein
VPKEAWAQGNCYAKCSAPSDAGFAEEFRFIDEFLKYPQVLNPFHRALPSISLQKYFPGIVSAGVIGFRWD